MSEAQNLFQQAKLDIIANRKKVEAEEDEAKQKLEDETLIEGGNKDWLKPEELAERWQVALSTIKRWMKSGKILTFTPGGGRQKRIDLAFVIRYEEADCPSDHIQTVIDDLRENEMYQGTDPYVLINIAERLEAILEVMAGGDAE